MTGVARAWVLAAVPSLVACSRAMPREETSSLAPAPARREAYVSNLSGVAFGKAFARATVDGAPSTDDRTSGGDQGIGATASASGNEIARACRKQGTQSHAQATAQFQPLPVPAVRQFGFTLSTTTYAKGGAWRPGFVLCRDQHNTVAAADAGASGRVDLTFSASTSEQLILRVSGATPEEARLEVRDGQDQLLPLSRVPGTTWVAATLASPGSYSVRAAIASRAESGGTIDDQRATSFSVSVQSMRDALALGYGEAPTNAVTIPIPVFMSADAMSAALDSALFTEQHRFYPCAKVACGTDRLRDVYLETPRVSTTGGSVVLEMRLAGSYPIALAIGSNVSGTIRAAAVPMVERDTLRFDSPSIDVVTHNAIVKWRSARFEQKLRERIRSFRIDLTPQLRAAVTRAQARLSTTWGGACLLLAPTEAHVRSVQVVTAAPQGIVANFAIEMAADQGNTCQQSSASR